MNQVFKIGDKVVSTVTATGKTTQKIKRGVLYIVHDVNFCFKCGNQSINVLGNHDIQGNVTCKCTLCKSIFDSRGLWWTRSIYFVRPEEISEAISYYADKEEYEICETLKQYEQSNLILK